MTNPNPENQFTEGNQAGLVHGGEGALRHIREGTAFKGLAAQCEREVQADLEASGRGEMLLEIAARSHTVLRLYWGAIQNAVDKGDLDKLDTYCKRFGWLAGVAGRAWAAVREEEKATGGNRDLLASALAAADKVNDGA